MTLQDGEYRFRSVSDAEDTKYLSIRFSGQVVGAPLDIYSDDQKWRVEKRSDGFYDIINVGTGSPVFVKPPSKDDIAYTLSVRGPDLKEVPWGLEVYNRRIIFKCSGKYAGKVVDLNTRNRLVLWVRTDEPTQLWIAENLSPEPAPIPKPAPVPSPKIKPHWVTVQGTNIPPNAIQCGWKASGERLYLARVKPALRERNRDPILGTATFRSGNCRVLNFHGDRETISPAYELLVADEGSYEWVPTTTEEVRQRNPTFPSKDRTKLLTPVPAMHHTTRPSRTDFVIRSAYNGAVLPGYTWLVGYAYIGDGNWVKKLEGYTNCEVLCYAD